MAASIGDVAREAGVSVATVSRALRGLPNVAPSTRERVLAAAEVLGYVADATAARLATGRTQTVGVAVTQIGQWFATEVLAGVEAVLSGAGYDLLLLTVVTDDERAKLAAGQTLQGRVDGLLAVDIILDDAQQAMLADTGVPAVFLGVDTPRFPSVGIDNGAAAHGAVSHLLQLGHRRIGLIGHVLQPAQDFPTARERRDGYLQALGEADVAPDPALEAVGNFSVEGGAEAAGDLLERPDPPTAIFALSDEMATGALLTLRERGLAVPGDMSVLGFDDHDVAASLGLTTVAQPVTEQAQRAADLLLSALGGADPEPHHVVLPTRLVLRSSTAPPSETRPHLLSGSDAPSMIESAREERADQRG